MLKQYDVYTWGQICMFVYLNHHLLMPCNVPPEANQLNIITNSTKMTFTRQIDSEFTEAIIPIELFTDWSTSTIWAFNFTVSCLLSNQTFGTAIDIKTQRHICHIYFRVKILWLIWSLIRRALRTNHNENKRTAPDALNDVRTN